MFGLVGCETGSASGRLWKPESSKDKLPLYVPMLGGFPSPGGPLEGPTPGGPTGKGLMLVESKLGGLGFGGPKLDPKLGDPILGGLLGCRGGCDSQEITGGGGAASEGGLGSIRQGLASTNRGLGALGWSGTRSQGLEEVSCGG